MDGCSCCTISAPEELIVDAKQIIAPKLGVISNVSLYGTDGDAVHSPLTEEANAAVEQKPRLMPSQFYHLKPPPALPSHTLQALSHQDELVEDGKQIGHASTKEVMTVGSGASASVSTMGKPSEGPSLHSGSSTKLLVQTLSSWVPPKLLRGVSLPHALRGYGKAWVSNLAKPEDADLSFEVLHLDDFLSHDWKTGRWEKLVALCIIYNGRAAFVASSCFAVSVNIIQILYSSPEHLRVSSVVSPIVFFTMLFHWQTVKRSLNLKTHTVFLDKLCINQSNSEMKKQAVCSLAGFLRSSNRLVILWSHRYLERLWCVYEIASWFHLGNCVDTVVFMPVSLAKAVFYVMILFTLIGLWRSTQWLLEDTWIVSWIVIPLLLVLLCVFAFSMAVAMTTTIHDQSALSKQLKEFKISQSQCFCCSCGHRYPNSDEVMQCDRELVYGALQRWSDSHKGYSNTVEGISSTTTDLWDSLEEFDIFVRETFGPFALQIADPSRMPYRIFLLAMCPSVWFELESMALRVRGDFDKGNLTVMFGHVLYRFIQFTCVKPFAGRVLVSFLEPGRKLSAKFGCCSIFFVSLLYTSAMIFAATIVAVSIGDFYEFLWDCVDRDTYTGSIRSSIFAVYVECGCPHVHLARLSQIAFFIVSLLYVVVLYVVFARF